MEGKYKCMVTNCKEDAKKYVFDGVFWVKVCEKCYLEFKAFAKNNNLEFKERGLDS